jgi:hypothetical protein
LRDLAAARHLAGSTGKAARAAELDGRSKLAHHSRAARRRDAGSATTRTVVRKLTPATASDRATSFGGHLSNLATASSIMAAVELSVRVFSGGRE